MIRIMTKKNTLAEGFGKFLLGLVEVCIAIALMAGTFVASAFLVVQGVFFIRDAYGFYGVATAWLISFMSLLFTCTLFQEKHKQDRA